MTFRNIKKETDLFGQRVVSWRNEFSMRASFTDVWLSLNTHVKSLIISLGGIVVATIVLYAAKVLFPHADFTAQEWIIVGAISTFIANIFKEQTLL